MTSSQLDEVESFMFMYRELHFAGKNQAFTALYRLYKEMKHNNLWIKNEEQVKRKEQTLNSLALTVISNAMMWVEEFLSLCVCIAKDITEIPSSMSTYRSTREIVKHLERQLDTSDLSAMYDILQYVGQRDLSSPKLNFLSKDDKRIILRQHDQNAKGLEYVLSVTLRVYKTFSNAYNKYKHGYLFLFSMPFGRADAPDLFKELGPMIPYFSDRKRPSHVAAVFVGEAILDKLNEILSGPLFRMSWDLSSNVTARCKYGGEKIIARDRYGPPVLTESETERYKELINVFDSKFLTSRGPKQLQPNLKSDINVKDWEWFLSMPTFK